jgi:hypothetical protein
VGIHPSSRSEFSGELSRARAGFPWFELKLLIKNDQVGDQRAPDARQLTRFLRNELLRFYLRMSEAKPVWLRPALRWLIQLGKLRSKRSDLRAAALWTLPGAKFARDQKSAVICCILHGSGK